MSPSVSDQVADFLSMGEVMRFKQGVSPSVSDRGRAVAHEGGVAGFKQGLSPSVSDPNQTLTKLLLQKFQTGREPQCF